MELHGGAFVNIERHIVWSRISADVVHDVLEYKWLCGGDQTGSPAVMPSTYFHLLGAEQATWLTIARKTTGPTLVPWGTPQDVGVQIENVPETFTHCCLSDRKLPTHLCRAEYLSVYLLR